MDSKIFEEKMRSFMRRTPFTPFIVKTDAGKLVIIENREAVALGGGGAAYIAPEEIHFLESQNVLDIYSAEKATAP
jgi:hypothetical protein